MNEPIIARLAQALRRQHGVIYLKGLVVQRHPPSFFQSGPCLLLVK